MKELKYSEILRLNNEIERTMKGDQYQVAVISNIITAQINSILEYSLRSQDINAKVNSGDYDNILQDSIKYNNYPAVIIFWETSNILEGLHYKANVMEDYQIVEIIDRLKKEVDFVLSNLQNTSLVVFNKFSSLVFNRYNIKKNNFDRICSELNQYLESLNKANLILIDIDKVLAGLSIDKSVDFRYFYSSKALYTVDFYKSYTQFIRPVFNSIKGKAKKALIFDCDNTLWKGILGEDGKKNIEMSSKTKNGVVFEEVQYLALYLSKKGILIGLCSKNNSEEVEPILESHPDLILKNENLTIKKINWEDKVSNLKSIAQELNIGLDSLVFIDDSDFEVGLVKDQLAKITSLKVPAALHEYPQFIREHIMLFYNITETEEDTKRVEIYKQQMLRKSDAQTFNNIESYLKSLELKIRVYENDKKTVPRVAQLTQKTNQFNLTTKRYTESDIENFLKDDTYLIFAFEVCDRYGNAGITGIAIIEINEIIKIAYIDTFLMSCRIIGRNIERSFFDFLVKYLKNRDVKLLSAKYLKTAKNSQVESFYESLNFECIEKTEYEKNYELNLNDYIFQHIDYIKLNYGHKD